MNYAITIKPSARKELLALPDTVVKRLDRAILKLSQDARPRGSNKLKGFDLYRIRVGDYRVLYQIDDESHIVQVVSIGHRRDVYR